MPIGCCIPKCRNSRRNREKLREKKPTGGKSDNVTFFRFPETDVGLREKWKGVVPRFNWEPAPHSRICSDHFTKNSFKITKHVIERPLTQEANDESKLEEAPVKVKQKVKYVRTLRPGSIPTLVDGALNVQSEKKRDNDHSKYRPPDKKIALLTLNPYLICAVCNGYYINPVTITECLHTFCRSCLVKHFFTSLRCPGCNVEVHPTEPLSNVRVDTLKQDILNRLLPQVEADEEKREISFYEERGLPRPVRQDQHKTAPLPASPGDHDDSLSSERGSSFYPAERLVSLVLEYAGCVGLHIRVQPLAKKFVRVAAAVTIAQLKRFVRTKLRTRHEVVIDLLCDNAFLEDDWDLEFVADFFYQDDPDDLIQLNYVISSHGLDSSDDSRSPTPEQAPPSLQGARTPLESRTPPPPPLPNGYTTPPPTVSTPSKSENNDEVSFLGSEGIPRSRSADISLHLSDCTPSKSQQNAEEMNISFVESEGIGSPDVSSHNNFFREVSESLQEVIENSELEPSLDIIQTSNGYIPTTDNTFPDFDLPDDFLTR